MSDDRMKMVPVRDCNYYRRRKHDKWQKVDKPTLETSVADSHAHIHMLPDPAWELVRCAVNGVAGICTVTDPSEDGSRVFDELTAWQDSALSQLMIGGCQIHALPPVVKVAVGVHPHNARLYDAAVEQALVEHLADQRVVALGEIGLDYHYDLSPRDVQRRVFVRQIELAKQFGLPIALHLRGGDNPASDDAHAEALSLLREVGFPSAGTIVHCCSLSPEELVPWIEEDCYIAYGGAVTFKNADVARSGAAIVPLERLLLETDAPYMAPEPMRGVACTPSHVVFTATVLAEIRGVQPGPDRGEFLRQLNDNAKALLSI